ncbi:hypothetical protein SynWH8101_1016 [Synechococcus sp. WH 8101]|uniref:hypothetical protein n=1 Tax=Synechococcus sp. WH 8101 TaxID=59932 RepID=UPI001023DA5C|nr:hypothetical protein [Synechococcus sp. WH 8101]QBE68604.1 hypothetical protein SynWH8101_1016 [Synechococcus sp. WH 8101]QNI44823.1 hypothetical protein SynRCC2555_01037 [Synechococcus sp. WH 8101]
MSNRFVFHIGTSYFTEEIEDKESSDYAGIQFDVYGDQVECCVEVDDEDLSDLTEETLCEWLGFDYEEILYTNYEDL